jgi:hypothetical protein
MKCLQLTLHHSQRTMHPMQEFILQETEVGAYHLLQGNMTDQNVWTTLFYIEAEQDPYAEQLEQTSQVIDYELIPVGDQAFYAYLREETAEPDKNIYAAFTQPTLVVIPPIEYTTEGSMRITVVGETGELQSAVDTLPPDIIVDVDRVQEFIGPRPAVVSVLSDRQYEALTLALEAGYYEIPRRSTVTEIAKQLDCTPGTASEHLRKGEAKLLTEILD